MAQNTRNLASCLLAAVVGLAATTCLAQTPSSEPAADPRAALDQVPDLSSDQPVAWPKPTNAAVIYWRAFFAYASDETLRGVDWSLLAADDDEAGYRLTPAEIKQLEPVQGMIATALRASRVESADWEIDYDLGINALLPQLGAMRNMARLMSADIRRCVTEGDIDAAVERLVALHAMSRHLRDDAIVISSLVANAITKLACTQTSHFLAQVALTPEQRDRLLTALDAYGTSDPFGARRAIGHEGVWLTTWLAEQIKSGRFGAEIDTLFGQGEGTAEEIERLKRLSDRVLIEDLRACRRYYEDAVSVWDERDAEDRLEAIGRLVEAGHYGEIAQLLASALVKTHMADDRGRTAIETARSEILADPLAPASSR